MWPPSVMGSGSRLRTTTPTKATRPATAQYLRRRRRVSRLASSISASTRASISSRSSGSFERSRRGGCGGALAGTPERGAVIQSRELVEFARGQGYAVDELVEMIEDVA
jgi:hypothetical protein